MHDIRAIRADPAAFAAALRRRGMAAELVKIFGLGPAVAGAGTQAAYQRSPMRSAHVLQEIDEQLRVAQTELQKRQARLNELSKMIGAAKSVRDESAASTLTTQVAILKQELPELEVRTRLMEEQVRSMLWELPNLPAADVPDGSDETANVVVHTRGTPPAIDAAAEHDALAAHLGYDPDAAAAIAGARFAVLKGPLARLHRALGQFMLDLHTGSHGYTEVAPPLLVREAAMLGTGQLPKFAEDSFQTTDGRWLIPTAEVSLTNLVREKILPDADLPLRFVALTPCFRQEAGSAGRDTRGLIRQHQFDKVELVSITRPHDSEAEHERMTAAAETVLDALGLPYRRMLLCAGDMGFSARKTFDLEVWLPGQRRYREISSCSNCGDFQARRMDARFRVPGTKPEFVHTLNGSGVAVGRALVAVIENYQRADGSVAVPEALLPYMGGIAELVPG